MAALLSMLRKKEVGLAFLHFPSPSTHKNKKKKKKHYIQNGWWIMAQNTDNTTQKKHAKITSVTVQIHLCMSLIQNI